MYSVKIGEEEKMKKVLFVLFFLLLMVFMTNCTNPLPLLTSIFPIAKTSNMPVFTLTVTGSEFINESKIVFNGVEKTTTFVNANELTCEINPADIASGLATIPVLVRTPSPGGGDSNTLNFTVNGNHSFTNPKQISFTGGEVWSRSNIVVDSTGIIHVVWQYCHWNSMEDAQDHYTHSEDNGDNWTSAIDVYNGSHSAAWVPVIGVDGSGNLNVLGESGTGGGNSFYIYFTRSTDGGLSWSPAIDITNTAYARFPDITVDVAGNINAVFQNFYSNEYDIYFCQSTNGGTSWSAEVNLSNNASQYINSTYPRITIDENNNVNVVWIDRDYGDYSVKFRRSGDNGSNWDMVKTISDTIGDVYMARIDTGSDGSIGLIWSDDFSGNYEVYFSRSTDNGSTWSSPANITNTTGDNFGDICIDNAGNINVIYKGNGLSFIRSTDNGTTWSTPVLITSSNHYVGSIEVDIYGNLFMVSNFNLEIYFTRSIF